MEPTNRKCSVEGCDREVKRAGLCRPHYDRRRLAGQQCAIEGCGRPIKAAGLCFTHYNDKRHGGKPCSVEGCDKVPAAKGLCPMHYLRQHKHGDAGEAGSRRNPTRPCKVEGCDNLAVTREDLCPTHRLRKRLYGTEYGTFLTHKKCIICGDPAVSGDRSNEHCRVHYVDFVKVLIAEGKLKGTKSPAGYVYHQVLKLRLAEHRVVMEHLLGRPLLRSETPHHKNGRRDDNRPENLELWVKPQPAGQRVEDLVAWVLEMYPEEVRAQLGLPD